MRDSEIKRTLRAPAKKADVRITIEANGERFSISAHRALGRRYRVTVGRTWSRKHPLITITEIFDLSRRWAARQERSHWRGYV